MEIVTTIAPIALALIMLGLGLGLSIDDFSRVIKSPKNFFVGSLCQLILLPIIAFIIIKIYNPPIELALGVMIIAAAPGGVTSNVLTKFANGDVALSISLTAIISLISMVLVIRRHRSNIQRLLKGKQAQASLLALKEVLQMMKSI